MSTTRKTTTKTTTKPKAPTTKAAATRARQATKAGKTPAAAKAKATTKAPAKATTPKAEATPKVKTQIQYYIDGRPTGTVDRLSRVAFFFTKGCNPANPEPHRFGVGELRDYLTERGVTDAEASDYEVELPNGKVLSAKVGVSEPLVRQPRSTSGKTEQTDAERAAAADARAKTRLGRIECMKQAAAKVKAAGRHTGPDKIEVTKDNCADLVAMSTAKIKALTVEAPAQPEVTPIPKPTRSTRRTRKAPALPQTLDDLTATA